MMMVVLSKTVNIVIIVTLSVRLWKYRQHGFIMDSVQLNAPLDHYNG